MFYKEHSSWKLCSTASLPDTTFRSHSTPAFNMCLLRKLSNNYLTTFLLTLQLRLPSFQWIFQQNAIEIYVFIFFLIGSCEVKYWHFKGSLVRFWYTRQNFCVFPEYFHGFTHLCSVTNYISFFFLHRREVIVTKVILARRSDCLPSSLSLHISPPHLLWQINSSAVTV